MTCEHIELPGGVRGIVCGRSKRRPKCKGCGAPATLECDWKKPRKRSGTCYAPICDRCSVSPAPDKDLCPDHAIKFKEWQAARNQ